MTGGVTADENVEVVRQGYVYFNRGEIGAMVDHMHEEIEWHDSSPPASTRVYKGADRVKPFLESFGRVWEDARFEPDEFIGGHDRVLVFVRFVARGRQSGADVDAQLAHVFEMRDRKCWRVVTYFDRERAIADFEGG